MICFFSGLALPILISAFVFSGKGLFLTSQNKDLVYELRVKNGILEHALRHGGDQILKWAPLKISGEKGVPELRKISVKSANHEKHEFVVSGFKNGILLNVKVENDRVFFAVSIVRAGIVLDEFSSVLAENSRFENFVPAAKNSAAKFLGAFAKISGGESFIFCESDVPASVEKIGVSEKVSMNFSQKYSFKNANGNLCFVHEIRIVDDVSALSGTFEKAEFLRVSE